MAGQVHVPSQSIRLREGETAQQWSFPHFWMKVSIKRLVTSTWRRWTFTRWGPQGAGDVLLKSVKVKQHARTSHLLKQAVLK